ncbi:hypothetical protein D1872_305720 [compost metagenome]
MAAQVFRRTVYDDICAKLKRTLEIWSQQRIVYNRKESMLARPVGYHFQISYHHERVGRCFNEYSFCIRGTYIFECIEIIGIHIGSRNAKSRKNTLEQAICPSVQIKRYD